MELSSGKRQCQALIHVKIPLEIESIDGTLQVTCMLELMPQT
jgi:hypothetical protein